MLSPRSALLAFLLPVTAFRDFPTICAWDPPIEIIAGDNLSARVANPQARRCEASLSFDDPAFLPIRYTFDVLDCDGLQLAEFTVPPTAPNGDAFVLWSA
ncbi:hypothetical protein PFICI_05952 [Pestalotiopsis fici W106-1]|uniref:Ubiquitin 3 binding protein But2 C-terminal domain-containing protein n=1 Tax=Pestalotiopsis fici (strain W106-1 / CGMCC3.15140) TaxID=1229662 RepID=W3XFT5_PESFW|nr:uncharacterized protein PFICI_05952 [Pestalotiopsis fici W106-1]ETS84076.1 hypothetical protein PFICI_05952 [Pestalotiopsis fici W106-1]